MNNEQTPEETRLTAAIAAIHDKLHRGDINGAHEACECAMQGADVTQANLILSDSAKCQVFAARFNELCQKHEMLAAWVGLFPSSTAPGSISMQLGGAVDVCKLIESWQHTSSVYMGEH